MYLFPPAMKDWLEEDHLVYRLLDVMDELDIRSVTHAVDARDARGTRPYNPRMMLALLFYAYSTGIYSTRLLDLGIRATWRLEIPTMQANPNE